MDIFHLQLLQHCETEEMFHAQRTEDSHLQADDIVCAAGSCVHDKLMQFQRCRESGLIFVSFWLLRAPDLNRRGPEALLLTAHK